jgi:hypothetical protein
MIQKTALGEIDRILATQLVVAWAGEGRSEPRRFGWWDTDLVDDARGGDLLARLAPRTHAWASLELVRQAARRVDGRARGKRGLQKLSLYEDLLFTVSQEHGPRGPLAPVREPLFG